MRIFLSLCLFLLLACGAWWLVQRYHAVDTTAAQAQSLENALQAVEWYTNESVNKALRAEAEGDLANARLFGDKAIESDLKAQDLRSETARAWLAAGQAERARAAWQRAAKMAAARAYMLADRIPPLQQQWTVAKAQNLPALSEVEIAYLQALIYTAEQWALVVQFSQEAADANQVKAGKEALAKVLLPIQQENLLERLAHDVRIADRVDKIHQWQKMLLPAPPRSPLP